MENINACSELWIWSTNGEEIEFNVANSLAYSSVQTTHKNQNNNPSIVDLIDFVKKITIIQKLHGNKKTLETLMVGLT